MVSWKPLALSCALVACTDIGDPAVRSDALAVKSGPLSFEGDIKPILVRAGCLGCHPSGGGGEADLDLSTPDSIADGGDSGRPTVVPCEHARSYMWYRVRWCEMPFPGYPNCLDVDDVATIAAWIDQGGQAEYVPGMCPDAAAP